ncbi:MAG: hypothetical protein ACJAX5_002965 [Patiriisocius sp.]|jgi:hypothetical protein
MQLLSDQLLKQMAWLARPCLSPNWFVRFRRKNPNLLHAGKLEADPLSRLAVDWHSLAQHTCPQRSQSDLAIKRRVDAADGSESGRLIKNDDSLFFVGYEIAIATGIYGYRRVDVETIDRWFFCYAGKSALGHLTLSVNLSRF